MALFPLYDLLTVLKDGVSRAFKVKGEMELMGSNNIAIGAKAVGTTAVALRVGASNLANRKKIHIQVLGDDVVYIGPSGVTAETGYPVLPGQEKVLSAGGNLTLYAIAETDQSVRIIEEA